MVLFELAMSIFLPNQPFQNGISQLLAEAILYCMHNTNALIQSRILKNEYQSSYMWTGLKTACIHRKDSVLDSQDLY